MQKISEFLNQASNQLKDISDVPDLDSQVLLANILGASRTWLAAHPEKELRKSQLACADRAFSRLKSGEPLAYILGRWHFYNLEFEITSDVLIPRPETELLVDQAISWIKNSTEQKNIIDVGTGSGCISIAIAKNISSAKILATDISQAALNIAQKNAQKHDVQNQIIFHQCDLLPSNQNFKSTKRKCDLLCANLPYIPTKALQGLDIYEREPTIALDGGIDGLDFIQRLLEIAPQRMDEGGMILMEIDHTQGNIVSSLAKKIFKNAELSIKKDLAGKNRLLEIRI